MWLNLFETTSYLEKFQFKVNGLNANFTKTCPTLKLRLGEWVRITIEVIKGELGYM
jgi:hypothetical protein